MADSSGIILCACIKCGIEKPHDAENFMTRGPKGGCKISTRCRVCHAESCRDYNDKNREALREYENTRRKETRHAGSDYYKKKWSNSDKEKARADLARWKLENHAKARAIEVSRNKRVSAQAKSDPVFREKLRKKARDWQRNKRRTDPDFREKSYEATRFWASENKEWSREYGRKRRLLKKDCPHHKIMSSVRSRINTALKGGRKSMATAMLIGAPIEVVRSHIEAKFSDGMTWDNWGRGWHGAREWHLDHIRPLSSFDLTNPDQLAEASHFKNLQPLWAKDNLKKGAKHGIK